MVYFKLTKSILDVIKASRLENLVGCQRYCDRQIISFNDLDTVLQKLRKELKDAKDKIVRKKEQDSKRLDYKNKFLKTEENEDSQKNQEMLKMQLDMMDMVSNKEKVHESFEELEEEIKVLSQYESLDIKGLTENTEIVFQEEHVCNDNLKIRYVDEAFMKPEEIIEENQKTMVTLKDCEKLYSEDPDVKKAREESHQIVLEEIKNRVEKKKYREMTKSLRGGDQAEQEYDIHQKQEARFTLAFGFGFITLMFLSFVCGYFLGTHIFQLSQTNSLILSLVVGISTIIMETILFVIRMEKMDQHKARLKFD
eukprot:403357183